MSGPAAMVAPVPAAAEPAEHDLQVSWCSPLGRGPESSTDGWDEIPCYRSGGSERTVEALIGLRVAELCSHLTDRLGEGAGALRHHPGWRALRGRGHVIDQERLAVEEHAEHRFSAGFRCQRDERSDDSFTRGFHSASSSRVFDAFSHLAQTLQGMSC